MPSKTITYFIGKELSTILKHLLLQHKGSRNQAIDKSRGSEQPAVNWMNGPKWRIAKGKVGDEKVLRIH
jgi:hypothetical protein